MRLRHGANPFIFGFPQKRFQFLLALASFDIPAVEVVSPVCKSALNAGFPLATISKFFAQA